MRQLSNKINIVQVVNGFGVGGGELKLLELIRHLNREKYNITVVSVGQGGPLEEKFRALGVPVHVLQKSWRFDLSLPFKLAKIFRRTRAQLVMCTLFYADVMSALASYFYRPETLISWEVITGRLKWYQKLAYKLLANRFDKVVAVSRSIHPFIVRDRGHKPETIRTIYYGVDTDKFKPLPRKKQEQIIFGTVARLVHQKGHTFLLNAIPKVLQKYPNAKWYFVGDGYKEQELREQARQLHVEHAVEFLGRQDNVIDFLNSFDVFVLPSLWEGFPNVLLEAMACARPVIATSVEGTVELVVDGVTGILVPPRNSNALARAMLQMLDNRDLIGQYGVNGRRRVEREFSLRKQIREFEALYDSFNAALLAKESPEYSHV